MYKFVKIKLKNWTKAQWYFKPESVQDINDFFKLVVKSEIADGLRDALDDPRQGVCHATTAWNKAVQSIFQCRAGLNWLEGSLELENQTYQDRIQSYLNGEEPLFSNGMPWLTMTCVDEIIEELETGELKFPVTYSISEVRYMQWGMPENKGRHWYAKIDKFDVRDQDGNMKWDTKAEAEAAAEWFLDNKI